mgnify:CR=1 FL=1
MNKIGVDTNVFIYAFVAESDYQTQSENFLQYARETLFTTTKNISEFIAVCSKLNIPYPDILNFIKEIKQHVVILFPDEKSLEKFEELITKYHPQGNRVYDIEIVSILKTNNINKLATFNIRDFKDIEEVQLIDMDDFK